MMTDIIAALAAAGKVGYDYPHPATYEHEAITMPEPIDILDDDGATKKYLLVKDREIWFNQFCAAIGATKAILTVREPRAGEPEGYSEVVQALVFIGGNMVATGYGSAQYVCYANGKTVLENAETRAKGRALATAGFNIPGGYEPGDKDGTVLNLADAPAGPVQPPVPGQSSNLPFSGPTEQAAPQYGYGTYGNPAPAPAPSPTAVPAPGQAAQPADGLDPATRTAMLSDPPANLEEAFQTVMPPGFAKHAGKTLREINAIQPNYLAWIAGEIPDRPLKSAARYPRLVFAAQMVRAATGQPQ